MISVIIVTYNSQNFIKKCLKSVYKNISNSDEVFVIDNNSQDKSTELITELIQQQNYLPAMRSKALQSGNNLKLIKNKENLGFAKANNQALRQAKGDYVFLINPDTEFDKNIFSQMIDFANQHKNAGIFGCQQIDYRNKPAGSFGNFPSFWTNIAYKLKLYWLTPWAHWTMYNFFTKHLFNKNKKVDYVGCGFTLIKKQVIDKIGLFDENFFLYYEDTDYCKRAFEAGFEVWYLGKIKVQHVTGASSNKYKIKKWSKESLKYYEKKYNL
ncbi:glycosyltransferase family 2 protein [Patescibacteria group bacterium]|nr:glycosyltransferase family 2 protein [Patescibacteria group bacterium]MBU4482121.1 glycosyltransferase family 2 protein [Patescibacteria group bacterium]